MLTFVTCLFGIVWFSTYEADLTTKMTVRDAPLSINSFEDVYQSDYKLMSVSGTSYNNFLQLAKEGSTINKLWRQTDNDPGLLLQHDCTVQCKQKNMMV